MIRRIREIIQLFGPDKATENVAEYMNRQRKALKNAQMDAEGAREMLYWADRLIEWYRMVPGEEECEPNDYKAYQKTTTARYEHDLVSNRHALPGPKSPKSIIPEEIPPKYPEPKTRG